MRFIPGSLNQYFTNKGHCSAKVSEIKEINYVLQPGIQNTHLKQGPFLKNKWYLAKCIGTCVSLGLYKV